MKVCVHLSRNAKQTSKEGNSREARVSVLYTAILARHGLSELTADGLSTRTVLLGEHLDPKHGVFGAKFVEVRVGPDLGLVRVARIVSAIDGGRILNEKTASSQVTG